MDINEAIAEVANLTNLTVLTRFDGTFVIQSKVFGCPTIAKGIESKEELFFILESEWKYQQGK